MLLVHNANKWAVFFQAVINTAVIILCLDLCFIAGCVNNFAGLWNILVSRINDGDYLDKF